MTGTLASATRQRDQLRARRPVNSLWLVDGQPTGVDPADRGLAYGDGLFETMAAHDGEVRRLGMHLDRLEAGCRRLEIPPPARAVIETELRAHCPRAGRAVVKLIVTRCSGARGYPVPERAQPTRVLAISPWPELAESDYRTGIAVRVCALRLGENPALAGLKHLNRLEQVLAQLELRGSGAQQGLLLDARDRVVGGTSCNVFVVRAGQLVTPTLARCGIKGVMRRAVLEAAPRLGIRTSERDLTLDEVRAADEVFMTNAIVGVWPVASLDAQRFAVGAVTRRVMAELGYDHGA
jgi:4-amino-4-deoxychorismate lyase